MDVLQEIAIRMLSWKGCCPKVTRFVEWTVEFPSLKAVGTGTWNWIWVRRPKKANVPGKESTLHICL